MFLVERILEHPFLTLGGFMLLLVGVGALRMTAKVTVIILALVTATAICRFLIFKDLVPVSVWTYALAYAITMIIILICCRHPIVVMDCEILFLLAITVFLGDGLANALHWPLWALWVVLICGILISELIPVAVFAAALLSMAFGAIMFIWSTLIFVICLLTLRIVHGRWTRTLFDPLLGSTAGLISACAFSGGEHQPQTRVLFTSFNKQDREKILHGLNKRGIKVERFPGDYFGAEVPRGLLVRWRLPFARAFSVIPDCCIAGNQPITVPKK